MNQQRRPATCHPDRESAGYGLCGSCYQRTRRAGIEMPARSQTLELGIRSSSVAVDQPASDLAWASWLIARDWADAQ